MSERATFKQNWEAPGLYRDVLIASMQHLSWTKQDALKIAEKAKELGDWEFSPSGL